MSVEHELKKLTAVWALRATLRPKAFSRFCRMHTADEEVLELVGLGHLIDSEVSARELKKQLSAQLKKMEKSPPLRKGHFFKSVDRLGEMMGFSPAEKELLIFSVLIQEEAGLERALANIGGVTNKQFVDELSHILKLKRSEMAASINQNGVLASSGLIQIKKGYVESISERIEVLHGVDTSVLEEGLEKTFAKYFHEGKKARLNADDFSHMEKDLSVLYPFLKNSLKRNAVGVNILIYGLPGTGKTEMARMVARDLGVRLHEVSSEDEDGDPADRNQRFRSYLLCQKLFSRTGNCLILFDEVEDVFPEASFSFFRSRRAGDFKGWTNRLLENNPAPAIWIANGIDQIDNAFIRRFDMVFEVPTPPRTVRKRILGKAIQHLSVNEAWIEKAASNDHLTPSHIEKAVKVACMAGLRDGKVLDHLITNVHRAMGYSKHSSSNSHGQQYDLRFLNTSHDLGALVETLSELNGGRVCLYGPPGCGKTAFVHYLGTQLDRPVILKRASDLLGSFVGETEQHIAAMFDEAQREDSILLLDEADSFLQDRGKAHRSWEITQVNELLVQMESYEGLFFCTTNFMDVLDSAVFRRFDLKVKFDYLQSNQVFDLFEKFMVSSLDEKEAWRKRLSTLKYLTPGDFVTAQRQLRLVNQHVSPDSFYKALLNEHNAKPGHSRAGFVFKNV